MTAVSDIAALISQPPHYSVGFILAGGASTRMGTDKAQVRIGQQTMLDVARSLLHSAPLNGHFVLGGEAADIREQHGGQGPASAICDVLLQFKGVTATMGFVLFMPVDMPCLSVTSISRLITLATQHQRATYFERHYLPLVVPLKANTIERITLLMAQDKSPSVRKLLQTIDGLPVTFDGDVRELANINRPEDLLDLQAKR